jgi:hypothetical protein
MPLFPVPTYSSWQLACIAAVEPLDPTHSEHAQSDEAIRAELRTRHIPDSEVEEMIGLARRIGKRISPIVCMDVDDLELGIATQFDAGEIDATERDRLLGFVATHVDMPREQRQPSNAKRGAQWWQPIAYLIVVAAFISLAQRVNFLVWLACVVAAIWVQIWVQQSWPSWRHRLRRSKAG